MMCQSFESVPVPYRLTAEMGDGIYHSDIPAPYGERLTGSGATGLWVDGDNVLMTGITDQRAWPSWGLWRWSWNVHSGAFVGRGGYVGNLYAEDINQGPYGELYLTLVTGQAYPLGPAPDYEVLTAEIILPGRFGYIAFDALLFDRVRDRAVLGGESATRVLRVFEFASGDHIRDLVMPYGVINIVHDQGTRVFALLANKSVISIDYETGQIFSYLRLPQISNVTWARIAWHKTLRRLLVVDYTPDNPDGTSTTLIRGYRYVNVPVHVCKPIPLTRLRKGVKSPVLVKQVGDQGEGVSGLAILTSGTFSRGEVVRGSVALDGDGEGRGEILGTDEGGELVEVSTEVACLL